MALKRHVFTSESVTEGHPDKVADQISDAVLDAILADDREARVACETLVTTGMAVVAGEITTSTYVHIPDIVRGTITSIGYTDANFGFDAQTCAIITSIDRQSADIALGVDSGGAGDQGMMFGYASDETASLMPLPIVLAHRLAERLATVRKQGDLAWLRPDGKTQVSVVYEGDKPVGVSKIVVSTQHSDLVDAGDLRAGVVSRVVQPVLREAGFAVDTVSDGGHALALLERAPFDAIISDLALPGIGGMDLLRTVRERGLEVPVIFVTGTPQLSTAMEAVEFGAFRYLLKPIDAEQLIEVVGRAVRIHKLADVKRQAQEYLEKEEDSEHRGMSERFSRALAGTPTSMPG